MTSILNVPPPSAFWGGLAKGSAKGSAFVSVGANKSPSRSAPFFGGAGAKGSGTAAGVFVMPEKMGSNKGGAGAGAGGAGASRSPPANGSASKSGCGALGGGENWPKGAGRGGVVRAGMAGGRGGVFGRAGIAGGRGGGGFGGVFRSGSKAAAAT